MDTDTSTSQVTTTYYLGGVEKVVRGSGTRYKRTIGGVAVWTHDSAGALLEQQTLFKDALGSVVAMRKVDTGVLTATAFDPWGQRVMAEDLTDVVDGAQLTSFLDVFNVVTTRGFTGHEMLDAVGVVHMNGRIYDPRLGRFIQADPFIDGEFNTQGYNRYSYGKNNPLNGWDPSGFGFFKEVFDDFLGVSENQTLNAIVTVGLNFIPGCQGWCSAGYAATYAGTQTHEYGGSFGDALKNGLVAGVSVWAFGDPSYEAVAFAVIDSIDPDVSRALRFLYYGVDTNSFKNTTVNLAHEVKNYYVSQEFERFANKNGMTLAEFNTLLTLNSFLGNVVAGGRYDENANEISGFTSRERRTLGVFWDVNDTILGYQGLLDASAYDYMTGKKSGTPISGCHSLGTLTCNNLVSRGYAPSAQLNSLPFGNIAVGSNAELTNLGKWDVINGGLLGRILNPFSNTTPCMNGGGSGAFCHRWDDNYRKFSRRKEL